jgi:hypothetical protein
LLSVSLSRIGRALTLLVREGRNLWKVWAALSHAERALQRGNLALAETALGVGVARLWRRPPVRSPEQLAHWVAVVGRRHPRGSCLRRSLVLAALLRHQGLRPTLQIGVQRQGDELGAHAWVELEGQALGEAAPPESTFQKLEPAVGR